MSASEEDNNIGCLAYETFESHARDFAVKSTALFDTWTLKSERNELFLVKVCQLQDLKMEYHIVYNVAFAVPVLYFRIFGRCNGEILWDLNVISKYIKDLHANKGLTQMPHPYYQTPFFQLHPCHTKDWMGKLVAAAHQQQRKNLNYIVAWLSFIAPHVGLVFSEKYAQ